MRSSRAGGLSASSLAIGMNGLVGLDFPITREESSMNYSRNLFSNISKKKSETPPTSLDTKNIGTFFTSSRANESYDFAGVRRIVERAKTTQ